MLINSLRILKDEEYQRRVWFRHEGPEVSTYIDTAAHLIGKCEIIFEDPSCVEYLGKEDYALLKKLYDLIIEHVDLTEDRIKDTDLLQENELLDNPNWHDIQTLANEVYIKLTDFMNREQQ